jgi:hypothetical protein
MINARQGILALPAQRENSRVVMGPDLSYECGFIAPREGVSDDYQIETVVATLSSRLAEAQGGRDLKAGGF